MHPKFTEDFIEARSERIREITPRKIARNTRLAREFYANPASESTNVVRFRPKEVAS